MPRQLLRNGKRRARGVEPESAVSGLILNVGGWYDAGNVDLESLRN